MLINVKKENGKPVEVTVSYNGKSITVETGGSLDVRDFGVPNEHIKAVEKHILSKNPNTFNVEETKDVYKTNIQALKRVDDLERENKILKEENETLSKAKAGPEKRINKLQAEIDGLNKENASLKKEVSELKAKVKNLQ
jgi:predicted  nucleic acid-binding Zn-ribbon protein